jgi:hypothetical protein
MQVSIEGRLTVLSAAIAEHFQNNKNADVSNDSFVNF